ncbi:lysozyme-like protein [Basidiobolus meristosporus CBS 931.73]|uniref:Lysozyme-like protein n=1 Tax=Basidiobolus meristosporus CBS 931.73 TaxID=1314790 RepID=A0A1Y1Y8G1_9FUNG|nr:lysozyme-like protein [Basidiobolus meristosporus CBS 931.73]|eukprot:ORX94322.1 lysozyme-like protein [Basidiobolus meristosporus CBS 931.73]
MFVTREILLLFILLISCTLSECASFPYCKGEYAINSNTCQKFRQYQPTGKNFQSQVQQWSYEDLDYVKRQKARFMVNVFEYGSTNIGYSSCENLQDGRGYTCGSVGFTTGTDDAYYVVEEYHKLRPGNYLDKYRKELQRLSNLSYGSGGKGSIKNLRGFPQDWKKASCEDASFREIQDRVADDMYYKPALKIAQQVGIRSELGKAIFYDTAVQHGWEEDDGIGLPTLLRMTGSMENKCEEDYLEEFVHNRWQMLCCTEDEVWPESADRTSDLMDLIKQGDFELNGTIKLNAYSQSITGHEVSQVAC